MDDEVAKMIQFEKHPSLKRPVAVCAFRGWGDGGEAASSAAAYLRDRWQATRFARVDPEEFFDFQDVRPTVRLENGVTRRIEWPANDFFHASPEGRDIVLFVGHEPNLKWRTFIEGMTSTLQELGVELLVTLGAFLADVPHTRDSPVTGTASNPTLAAGLGLTTSRYEGPTGIVGVLHDAASRAGLDSVSLWAAVPHYLPAGPNPRATLALLQRLSELLEIQIASDTLERAASAWEQRVNDLLAENPELRAFVQRLEDAVSEQQGLGPMPTGDELAAELERFLREQRGEGDR